MSAQPTTQHTRFDFDGAQVCVTKSDRTRYDGATIFTVMVDGVHAGVVYKPVNRRNSGLVSASRPWISKDARSQTPFAQRTKKSAIESLVRTELRSRQARAN